ncbi:MAG: DUF4388 domain-containing protein [Kiritimatiellae bacterium]|nr:DUF4388 domain-containing protein [Kiritimatiellia bacterium]
MRHAGLTLAAALLLSAAARASETPPNPQRYLRVEKAELAVPIENVMFTTQTGLRLELFQSDKRQYIAKISTVEHGERLVAFPKVDRGNPTAWVTKENLLIFGYPTRSVAGRLTLDEGDELDVLEETDREYIVLLERHGYKAPLTIPKSLKGITVAQRTPEPSETPDKAPTAKPVAKPAPRKPRKAVQPPEAPAEVQHPAPPAPLTEAVREPAPAPTPVAAEPEPAAALLEGIAASEVVPEPAPLPEPELVEPRSKSGLPVAPPPLLPARVPARIAEPAPLPVAPSPAAVPEPPAGLDTVTPAIVEVPAERIEPTALPPDVHPVEEPAPATPPATEPGLESRTEPAPASTTNVPGSLPPPEAPEPEPVQKSEAPREAPARPPPPPASPFLRFSFFLERHNIVFQILLAVVIVEAILIVRMRKKKVQTGSLEVQTFDTLGQSVATDPFQAMSQESGDFSGSLEGFAMTDLIQFLNTAKESGVLVIKNAADSIVGQMYLREGEIIDAFYGEERGKEAIVAAARGKNAFFTFNRKPMTGKHRTIRQTTTSLLVSAAQEEPPAATPNAAAPQ